MNSFNKMLWEDREAATDVGVTLNPSITINSQMYHGEMKGEEIFKSICKAYHTNTQPEVCMPDFDIQMAIGHMEDLVPPTYGHFHFIGIIIIAILINVGLVIWCMKRKRRDNDDEIQQ